MESKLRVTKTTTLDNTHFYGDSAFIEVTEHIHVYEFDKRQEIAPKDVKFRVKTDKFELNIKVDAEQLDYNDDENVFYTIFNVGGTPYELSVEFENGEIKNAWLEEWYENSYFEDGDPADVIYIVSEGTMEVLTD